MQTSPTHAFCLAQTRRNGLIENQHWGWIALCDTHGALLYSTPSPASAATPIFLRSCAKPFQSIPLVSTHIHTQLTPEELAITCASHWGSTQQRQLAQQILEKAGLNSTHLGCGPHEPRDTKERNRLILAEEAPTAIHNNCSGKHAGMLFYCVKNNLPTTHYLDPEHPLQAIIAQLIQNWSGLSGSPLQTAIDGCGAPTYYLPLSSAATLYGQLTVQDEAQPILDVMARYPDLIGSPDSVDSAIIKASRGNLTAKVGADGVISVCNRSKKQGLVLKVADGSAWVRDRIMVQLLKHVGWLDDTKDHRVSLDAFTDLTLQNTQNRPIGTLEINLP